MATYSDVQDILNVPIGDRSTSKPGKKSSKAIQKRPDGVSREVFALMGERAPPVPLSQPPQYKAKLSRPTEHVKWLRSPFRNGARSDGLVLHHWTKRVVDTPAENSEESRDGDTAMVKDEGQESVAADLPYRFAKYNVQLDVPVYTEDQYDQTLQNDGWTKAETDYLMENVRDCYGKWAVIWDRYDFHPMKQESDEEAGPPQRSVEDLKARYYEVKAKIMSTATPLGQMNQSEFSEYERMMKFNKVQEQSRKRHNEALLVRNADEKREEEFLLAELKRIYMAQEKFGSELKDIRDRLDYSLTTDKSANPTQYMTYAEIAALFQKTLNQDRTRRRRSTITDANNAAQSPTTAGTNAGTPVGPGPGQKRGSIVVSTPTTAQTPGAIQNARHVPPRLEPRFGITSHERLTSGVSFRSDKLTKTRTAKSQAQNQKIASMLTELRVPDLIQMPTRSVVESMETMIGNVTLLIEARKNMEKLENEIMVAEEGANVKPEDKKKNDDSNGVDAEKEAENQKDDNNQDEDDNDEEIENSTEEATATVETDDVDENKNANSVGKPDDDNAPTETKGTAHGQNKRSMSVVSASSNGSRTSKRLKSGR